MNSLVGWPNFGQYDIVDVEGGDNLQYVWLILGAPLIADTLFAAKMSNLNLGVLLPGFLGIPLVCYGCIALFAPQILELRWAQIAVCIAAVCYLLLLVALLGCVFCTMLYAARCKNMEADAVIVLGAGLRKNRPSRLLRMRLNAAIRAAQKDRLPILVTGGKGRQEELSEAEAMRDYLLEQGVSHQSILLENQACNTYENLKFSRKILLERFSFLPRVLIVTSDFHCFRSAQIAKKFFREYALWPVASAWYMKLNFYLREMLSIANYYRRELFQK